MLEITPIPALADNYIWLLQKERNAIVFDPAAAQPVLDFVRKNGLNVTACLLTHNHSDHTDGVAGLVEALPNLPIFGPAETAAFTTQVVYPKQQFQLLDLAFEVVESAGHTAGHISYFVENHYLFCGDSLFSGGCGRVFTGDYAAQFQTLQRIKQLPVNTQIFPAHEYTQNNLRFAAQIAPENRALQSYQHQVDALRSQNCPTLPTTLENELQINPFLQAKTLAEFISLRKQRDNF